MFNALQLEPDWVPLVIPSGDIKAQRDLTPPLALAPSVGERLRPIISVYSVGAILVFLIFFFGVGTLLGSAVSSKATFFVLSDGALFYLFFARIRA